LGYYSSFTDRELLDLLREGDEAAFTDLYKRYWDRLYVVAMHTLGSHPEAEEAVHTAEMVRHIPRTANFDFTTGLFSWLSNGEFPVNTNRPKTFDAININRDGILVVRIVFFCLLPVLLFAYGTLLLILRKRR